jgi:hypothetical protein
MDESLRAGDRDRDQVTEALREHYAQGRLTLEEYDERTTAATSAVTMGDLRGLTVDLPPLTPVPAEPQGRAWSPTRMRLIAGGGVVAAVAVLIVLAIFGRLVLTVPTWLFILIAVRLLHGRRRMPSVRAPRPPR